MSPRRSSATCLGTARTTTPASSTRSRSRISDRSSRAASADTEIKGLNTVKADDRPPVNIVHWSFDVMVLTASALALLAAVVRVRVVANRRLPKTRWFLRCAAVSGVAILVTIEAGWFVTEVGRQPWIVYNVLRTKDAVTDHGGIWITFGIIVAACTSWSRPDSSPRSGCSPGAGGPRTKAPTPTSPTDRGGPSGSVTRTPRRGPGRRSASDGGRGRVHPLVRIIMYSVLGGADYGAGFWDLLAGGTKRGERPRGSSTTPWHRSGKPTTSG